MLKLIQAGLIIIGKANLSVGVPLHHFLDVKLTQD